MIPSEVVSSFTGTLQAEAAAINSILRAVAPACLSGTQLLPMDLEPPAICQLPKRPTLSGACSTSTLFQSISSSSATNMGIEVFTFCPISGLGDITVAKPLSPIFKYPFSSNQFFGSALSSLSELEQEASQLKLNIIPPLARETFLINSLLEFFVLNVDMIVKINC